LDGITAIEAAALQPHLDVLGLAFNALGFIPEFFLDVAPVRALGGVQPFRGGLHPTG